MVGTAISLFAFSSQQAMACATCGCTLTTDWGTQGVSNYEGLSIDVRYDYVNQNMLRQGNSGISGQQASQATNVKIGTPAEVEQYTRSSYITTAIDYNQGDSWGVTATIPYVSRVHSTYGSYGAGADPYPAPGDGAYNSQGSSVGDMRLVARYYGFAEQKNWGLQLGIKAPTGQFNQTAVFSSTDGTSQKQLVDPGLQAGSGSWDSIIGAYKYGFINDREDWGYFSQILFQSSFRNSSTPSGYANSGTYRPGNGMSVNLGVNYQGVSWINPTVQINYLYKQSDSGSAGDAFATGGNIAYLTPGFIIPVQKKVQIYGNVQLPVYQNVYGIQLVPSYIASGGVRVMF